MEKVNLCIFWRIEKSVLNLWSTHSVTYEKKDIMLDIGKYTHCGLCIC